MALKTHHQLGRRNFIKNISATTAILLTGNVLKLSASQVWNQQSSVILRFVVASDFHYGQPDTDFESMSDTIIAQINHFHQNSPIEFVVANGDLIHNEKKFLPLIKQKLEGLKMPYTVTRGNHDMVSESDWQETWHTPLNHHLELKDQAFILADSSDEKGTYLSPDLGWLGNTLKSYSNKKNIFLFVHVPQIKFTNNCIDTPAFWDLIKQFPNLKAVFHGHDHDIDSVYMKEKLPFIFDAHAGGNWGTTYKGFRVVELMEDGSLITYMMNPSEKLPPAKI